MDSQPIVVALGANESFYACWKDKDGNYQQGSVGHFIDMRTEV